MNSNTQTLDYYVSKAHISLDELRKSVPDIELFLSGEKQPTFSHLSKIAKKINIPTGLLLLDNPVEVESRRLQFRTLNSTQLEGISEELRDTIIEMESKQAFLREEIEHTLDFIGSCSIHDNVLAVASKIRQELQLNKNFQEKIAEGEMLSFLREKINKTGVFVFFNGKVGDNTNRPLSLKEFRGFVLSDDKAPIIFINQKDETNGKVFTLIHELVHLFVGSEEIFVGAGDYTSSKEEAFVNTVTSEILVPRDVFANAVEKAGDDYNDKIQFLAKKFRVSKMVIAIRLREMKFINQAAFLSIKSKLEEDFKEYQQRKIQSLSKGGDYYNNLRFRMDGRFFNYVQQALQQNKISYTDAFRIIGVSFKGYKALAGEK